MEIEVTGRTEKALLDREEIELDITHRGESTPSEDAVRKKLAAELDLDPLTIAVDGIYSSSGVGRSRGVVTVHEEQVVEEVSDEEGPEDEAEGSTEEEADEEDADDEADDGSDADDEEDAEDDSEDAEEPDGDGAGDEGAEEPADEDEDETEDDS